MSLKFDIDEHPYMWSEKIVSAVEDYKNGEINSKRKLRKFVDREISEYYYNELIERHRVCHLINKEKRERARTQKVKEIFASIIILASWLCTIVYLIEHKHGHLAFWYFLLFFWAIDYISKPSSK